MLAQQTVLDARDSVSLSWQRVNLFLTRIIKIENVSLLPLIIFQSYQNISLWRRVQVAGNPPTRLEIFWSQRSSVTKQIPMCRDTIGTTPMLPPWDLEKENNGWKHIAKVAYCALSNPCLNPFEFIVSLLTEAMEVVSHPVASCLCVRDYLTDTNQAKRPNPAIYKLQKFNLQTSIQLVPIMPTWDVIVETTESAEFLQIWGPPFLLPWATIKSSSHHAVIGYFSKKLLKTYELKNLHPKVSSGH